MPVSKKAYSFFPKVLIDCIWLSNLTCISDLNSISGYFYFDESQLVYSDSVHSSQSVPVYHTFEFQKKVLGSDSLMFKISTDCNDDGVWSEAETVDDGNGLWDPSEPFLDQNEDGSYSTGEPFLDRNCNNQWDDIS